MIEALAATTRRRLYDELPPSWYVSPTVPTGWLLTLVRAPKYEAEYRVFLGGNWMPREVIVYGRAAQPHPATLATCKLARGRDGRLLVARFSCTARPAVSGHEASEVRDFDLSDPGPVVAWLVEEAKARCERSGLRFMAGAEYRAKVKAAELAKVEEAVREAERQRQAQAEVMESVRREHRGRKVARGWQRKP